MFIDEIEDNGNIDLDTAVNENPEIPENPENPEPPELPENHKNSRNPWTDSEDSNSDTDGEFNESLEEQPISMEVEEFRSEE